LLPIGESGPMFAVSGVPLPENFHYGRFGAIWQLCLADLMLRA
jgi:hypothetical protein